MLAATQADPSRPASAPPGHAPDPVQVADAVMNGAYVPSPPRTVLLLQGGGALGAYQAGVYEAMVAADLAPNWIIGTSIGAINAALIAGNPPWRSLEHLYEFWGRMSQGNHLTRSTPTTETRGTSQWRRQVNALSTMTAGIPGFFAPRWWHDFVIGQRVPTARASFYATHPLKKTLLELVDFDYLNASPIRLSVGAVDVESGAMRYFDSRQQTIEVEHILASCALPPAFPAVHIDGRHYWDGGLHSNTPLEWLLRDEPRCHSLCFLATLWPSHDTPPETLGDVLRRRKELQYGSRSQTLIDLERELHQLRHTIALLGSMLPATLQREAKIAEALELGCLSTYHLVRLEAPRLPHDDASSDIDFSPGGIETRWVTGFKEAGQMLTVRPWERPIAANEGVILHDFSNQVALPASALG